MITASQVGAGRALLELDQATLAKLSLVDAR